MTRPFITALKLGAGAALAVALAGCGPDGDGSVSTDGLSLLEPDSNVQWPTQGYGFADAGYPGGVALPPLPQARPMRMAPPPDEGGYGYAPAYYDDYYSKPSDYYAPSEPVYYDDQPGDDSYAFLALAALLGTVLADSPPDYAFQYGGVEPWVWETGDRYVRYAEPIQTGYRYYYYEPGAARPFLVRDPYYSYGYRDDRLVVIYDRDGRVIDRDRALRQRRLAERYYDRGTVLYRAGADTPHFGVAAPLWASRRPVVARAQSQWNHARAEQPAWRDWDRRHEPVVEARWAQEHAARSYAGQRFAHWQQAAYRGPAPDFYREAAGNKAVRKAALVERTRAIRSERAVAREERRAVNTAANQPRVQRTALMRPDVGNKIAEDRKAPSRPGWSGQRQIAQRQAAERQTAQRQSVQRQSVQRQSVQRQAAQRQVVQRQAAQQRGVAAKQARAQASSQRKAASMQAQRQQQVRASQQAQAVRSAQGRRSVQANRAAEVARANKAAQNRSAELRAAQTRQTSAARQAQARASAMQQRSQAQVRQVAVREQRQPQRAAMPRKVEMRSPVQTRSVAAASRPSGGNPGQRHGNGRER